MFPKNPLLQPEIESTKEKDNIKIFNSLEELDPYNNEPFDPFESIVNKFLLIFVSGIVFFGFSIFSISLLTLLFQQSLSNFQFYAGVGLTLLFTVFSSRLIKLKWFFGLGAFVLIAVSVFGGLIFSRSFYDLTYDGQSYHQSGVMALDKGWNPFYQQLPEGFVSKSMEIWTKAYPHANNLMSLSVYRITNNLEDGKLFGFLLIFASMIFCFLAVSVFTKKIFIPLIISLIVGVSPVNLMQVFSFGLDGQFYCLSVILLSILAMIYRDFYKNLNYFNLFVLIVLVVNNKLTSVAYLVIFMATYFAILMITKVNFKLILS